MENSELMEYAENICLMEDAIAYARQIFQEDFSGHDIYHTLRVDFLASRIAEKEGANLRIVRLAALLHDVDDRKLSPETWQNKDRAVAFLREHRCTEEEIARIKQILEEVSFRGTDSVVPETLEGKCVQDADRLDAIGAIGIARTFAYGGSHGRPIYDPQDQPVENMDGETYANHTSASLNHFYEKLFLLRDMMNTETAKQMAEKRDRYMRDFVAEFLMEWLGKA